AGAEPGTEPGDPQRYPVSLLRSEYDDLPVGDDDGRWWALHAQFAGLPGHGQCGRPLRPARSGLPTEHASIGRRSGVITAERCLPTTPVRLRAGVGVDINARYRYRYRM
ncbi:hypothetical protein, partial [Frankia sp. CcWB3]